jgi:hypothetical protein
VNLAKVSAVFDTGLCCKPIGGEAKGVPARVDEVTGQQNKAVKDDAVATGVSLVLFWPAAFLSKATKPMLPNSSLWKKRLTSKIVAMYSKKATPVE